MHFVGMLVRMSADVQISYVCVHACMHEYIIQRVYRIFSLLRFHRFYSKSEF